MESVKKRIILVAGARPNFMKIAPISRALGKYSEIVDSYIIHTGQHYDYNMSDAFFRDLAIPQPKVSLGVGSGSHSEQTAKIMIEFEKVCLDINPDLVIVVGDVNSTIACTLTAVKMGIRVAHVEGGLRSFDTQMPEEINRMATDAICNYCFITEESAKINLRNNGWTDDKIFFVGNTMIDSLVYAQKAVVKSNIINSLGLLNKKYALVTLHRPSNVDSKDTLSDYVEVLNYIASIMDIVFPVHPRTLKNLEKFNLIDDLSSNTAIHLIEPQGYIDFISLMLRSKFVLTDSGGIQEETTFAGIPCITARTTTERPVTVDIGSNILVKPNKENIIEAVKTVLGKDSHTYSIPPHWDGKAGERIAEIIVNKLI